MDMLPSSFPKKRKPVAAVSIQERVNAYKMSRFKCEVSLCCNLASFEMSKAPKHRVCHAHYPALIKDVAFGDTTANDVGAAFTSHKFCAEAECCTRASFGPRGTTFYITCALHADPSFMDLRTEKCVHEGCNAAASVRVFTRCSKRSFCAPCARSLQTLFHPLPVVPSGRRRAKVRNSRSLEKQWVSKIAEFPEVRRLLSAIQMNQRVRLSKDSVTPCKTVVKVESRPDFLGFGRSDDGKFCLIVEIDEHAHVGYDAVKEVERMLSLSSATESQRCCFVRFNPHGAEPEEVKDTLLRTSVQGALQWLMKNTLLDEDTSECVVRSILLDILCAVCGDDDENETTAKEERTTTTIGISYVCYGPHEAERWRHCERFGRGIFTRVI